MNRKSFLILAFSSVILYAVPIWYFWQLIVWPFAPLATVGAAAAAFMLAVSAWLLGWKGWRTTLLGVVGLLLFGPLCAQTGQAVGPPILGWHFNLNSWSEFLIGVVGSWKAALTTVPPLAPQQMQIVFIVVTCYLMVYVALVLIRSPRFSYLTPLTSLAALIIAIIWGRSQMENSLWGGIIWVICALIWWAEQQYLQNVNEATKASFSSVNQNLGYSLTDNSNLSRFPQPLVITPLAGRRKWFSLLNSLVVLIVVSLLSGGLVYLAGPYNRDVLRDHVRPPVHLDEYISPLAYYRSLSQEEDKAGANKTVLEVFGYQPGQRIRFATMDRYNGTVFAVEVGKTAKFYSSTGQINKHPSSDEKKLSVTGKNKTARIKIGAYGQPWLPLIGRAKYVTLATNGVCSAEIHFSDLVQTGYCQAVIPAGTEYKVDYQPELEISHRKLGDARFGQTIYRDDTGVPAAITRKAIELTAAATSPVEKIQAIQNYLRKTGFYSDGKDNLSDPGHRESRLSYFLDRKYLIGDDEQYAATMALLARAINAPARVVIGAYPDPLPKGETPAAYQRLTGRQVHAWVEVEFEGYGWVPFDATPPRENKAVSDQPKPKSVPKPQVLQPPAPPVQPPSLPHVEQKAATQSSSYLGVILLYLVWIGYYAGILLLLLLPFLLIKGAKWWRRRKRFQTIVPREKIQGAWLEALDYSRDCGVVLPRGATRIESGTVIDNYLQQAKNTSTSSATTVPSAPTTEARDLAALIDYSTYGPQEVTAEQAAAAWEQEKRFRQAIRETQTRWQRWRVSITPTSLWRQIVKTSVGRLLVRIPLLGRWLAGKPDPIWSSLQIGSTSQEYLAVDRGKTALIGKDQPAAPSLEVKQVDPNSGESLPEGAGAVGAEALYPLSEHLDYTSLSRDTDQNSLAQRLAAVEETALVENLDFDLTTYQAQQLPARPAPPEPRTQLIKIEASGGAGETPNSDTVLLPGTLNTDATMVLKDPEEGADHA